MLGDPGKRVLDLGLKVVREVGSLDGIGAVNTVLSMRVSMVCLSEGGSAQSISRQDETALLTYCSVGEMPPFFSSTPILPRSESRLLPLVGLKLEIWVAADRKGPEREMEREGGANCPKLVVRFL